MHVRDYTINGRVVRFISPTEELLKIEKEFLSRGSEYRSGMVMCIGEEGLETCFSVHPTPYENGHFRLVGIGGIGYSTYEKKWKESCTITAYVDEAIKRI